MASSPTGNTVEFVAPAEPARGHASSGRMNWFDCHSELANTDMDRGAAMDSRYNSFDDANTSLLKNEAELLNIVLANQGLMFILLPSTVRGSVQLVHNCFVFEDNNSI